MPNQLRVDANPTGSKTKLLTVYTVIICYREYEFLKYNTKRVVLQFDH